MDFRSVIARLEQQGNVVHVKSEVDPVHELAGIAKKFEGQAKVVVFDRVKGQKYPVACGLWWNRDIIGSLFGVNAGEVPGIFAAAGKRFQEKPVPPVVSASATRSSSAQRTSSARIAASSSGTIALCATA